MENTVGYSPIKLINIVRLQLFSKESGMKCLILGGKLHSFI